MQVLWIVLGVCLALVVFLFLFCGFAYRQIAWRKTFKLPRFLEKLVAGNVPPGEYDKKAGDAKKAFEAYPLEALELCAPDGATLRGKLLKPKKPNGRLVIACHGARSSGTAEFCFMGPWLYERGYTVFMPDHRGCGESDGKFMGYGTHESKDTYLWFDLLKKRFPDFDFFLLGISMGGATVLMMSDKARDEAIKGIIADCPYTSAWDEFSYHLRTSFHLPEFPLLHICDLFSRVFAGYSFKDASPLSSVKNAKKPVLFIHGDRDDFVPFYMRDVLYEACPTEKFRLTVEGAVHARSYYQNPTAYQQALEDFADKYAGVQK